MPCHRVDRSLPNLALLCAALGATCAPGPADAAQPNTTMPSQEKGSTRGVVILKAEPKAAPAARPQPCARPIKQPDMFTARYKGDSNKFDRDLARKLKARKGTVSVDLATPYLAGEDPPPMIGIWLEEIRTSGGKVTSSEYCQKSRGLFSFLGRLIQREPVDRLAAIRNYDAVLQVNGAEQTVTQIEFKLRSAT